MSDSPADHVDDSAGLSPASVAAALDDAKKRMDQIHEELAHLQMSERAVAEEIALLERLLRIKSGELPAPVDSLGYVNTPSKDGSSSGRRPHEAVDAVVDILATAGHPLHISELMRELNASHTPLPGAGAQANVISHISRDDRIERVARGIYGLREWEMVKSPASRRRPKTARTKSSMKTGGKA